MNIPSNPKQRRFGGRLATAVTLTLAAIAITPTLSYASPASLDDPTVGSAEEIHVAGEASSGIPETEPFWLSAGRKIAFPREGGHWEYGFWNANLRSYYTVNRCHGSSVSKNGHIARSMDTPAGRRSVAERWALQNPWDVDRYYYRVC